MKEHKKRLISVVMFFIVINIFVAAVVKAEGQREASVLVAYLSSNQNIPGRNTISQGKVIFRISDDGEELYFKLTLARKNIASAHIHMASKGENGYVVAFLFDENQTDSFTGGTAEGIITANDLIGPLIGNPLSALLREMAEGYTYIDVHAIEDPTGDLRGRIVDPLNFSD
jgi:hypothetical protein